jgi:hypothetical protein
MRRRYFVSLFDKDSNAVMEKTRAHGVVGITGGFAATH